MCRCLKKPASMIWVSKNPPTGNSPDTASLGPVAGGSETALKEEVGSRILASFLFGDFRESPYF